MTGRSERVFLPALREVEGRLRIPLTRRMRILRELEYDLEEMRARFVSHGMSQEEARSHALEVLVPDGAALSALGRLHAPLYRRATRGIATDRLRMIERGALAAATVSVLVIETFVLLQADLLRDPSPFLWPVLGLGGCLFALVVAKAFLLWVRADDAGRVGLGGILGLAAGTVGAGVAGVLTDVYRLAGTLAQGHAMTTTRLVHWLVREAAMLSVAILIGLAGALAWLVLSQWLTLVVAARRELLELPHGDTFSNGRYSTWA